MKARGQGGGAGSFHRRYLSVVEDIERNFPVARWRAGDVEIWPLARMDLYNDMYHVSAGGYPPPARPLPFPLRVIAGLATPLTNCWRSRRDLAHRVVRPRPAYAIVLGDGVSLDRFEGAWQDRYAEPVIGALERRGLSTFVMQPGELRHLPWRRPTFAANVIGLRGSVAARWASISVHLPAHESVLRLLGERNIDSPSLDVSVLVRRARSVFTTASTFERVLDAVKPTLAFTVTYYAGLGAAFLVACRRRGILSIDLQHCPQDGSHKAYGWQAMPATGYAALPAVFWNWTERDAAHIRRWTSGLNSPWHRSLHGGHTQLAPFMNDDHPSTRAWEEAFERIEPGRKYSREILVALQPIGGHRRRWDALAEQIRAAPANWRWWIRRHPASRGYQDSEYASLLSLDAPNVNVAEASSMPLPGLLRHMSVLLSLASGASGEAAAFGVPALFLSDEARGPFGNLIDQGSARVIDVATVNEVIESLTLDVKRPAPVAQPDLDATLLELERHAREYAALAGTATG